MYAIASTNYEVYSHTVPNNGNPFDIVNYVYPEDLSYAQSSTGITVDIMNLFSNLFEEYPFASEKYGHAQFGWGGGMEHTTVSFMGNFSRNLIAHEYEKQQTLIELRQALLVTKGDMVENAQIRRIQNFFDRDDLSLG